MSVIGRNSDQKNKPESKLTVPSSILEIPPMPNNFHFWNGDEYTGQAAIFKDKQMMMMHGRGVYTTLDGQVYEGIWENDYLKDDCKITFPDQSVFSGSLNEMIITGPGKYSFKEKVQLEGEFVNNNLVGNVYIKDPNQNYWKGKINEKENFVTFYPLHPFWQSVLNCPSKDYSLFYGENDEEDDALWEQDY